MTIESPKQKRGGASRPKDNFTISPFGSAACAARFLLVLLRGSASVNVIELPKQKRGGASRPKDNLTISPSDSAACAARLLCPALLSYRPPSRYPEIPVRFIAPYRFGTTRRQTRG